MSYDKSLETVKTLLCNKHIDLNLQLANGKSIFQYTIFNRIYGVASLLLQNENLKLNKNDIDLIFNEGSAEIIDVLLNTTKFTNFNDYLNEYMIKMIKRIDIPAEILASLITHVDFNFQDMFGKTALIYSAENGNIQKLNYILENTNVDLTIIDNYGMNALMYAVSNRNYACAKILVDYIKDKYDDELSAVIINQHNEIKETSILMTTKNNDTATFELLYDTPNINLNCTDIFGYSPLHYTIEKSNMDIFDVLVNDRKVNINIQDLEGNTPIISSIKSGNELITYKLLVRNDLNLNITNNFGKNVVGCVLEHKYSLKFEKDTSVTGFMGVSKREYAEFPECLSYSSITQMRDINLRDVWSPCENKSVKFNKLINFLIQKKIDINNFDIYNKSLLTYAIDNQDKEIFNFLINSKNLNINAKNNEEKTYLMYLFEKINGINDSFSGTETYKQYSPINFDIDNEIKFMPNKSKSHNSLTSKNVSSLEDKSAYLTFFMQILNHPNIDINATDNLNNTLLSLIASTNHINLLSKVIKHKNIIVNAVNYEGLSSLMIAIMKGLWNNAKVLMEHGGNPNLENYGKSIKHCLNNQNLFIYEKLLAQFNINANTNNSTQSTQSNESTQSTQSTQSTDEITNEENKFDLPCHSESKKGWFF